MFSKVRVTDEVPAPDEPVMAMMGWRSDMAGSPEGLIWSVRVGSVAEQAAFAEQRVVQLARRRLAVVALDALDLVFRAEDQPDALVQ